MTFLDDFDRMKREEAKLRSQVDKAKGALQQILKRLKEEFGCETVEEGEKLLKKLTAERDAKAEKYLAERKRFKSKWKDKL
jgi:hypothetical protein